MTRYFNVKKLDESFKEGMLRQQGFITSRIRLRKLLLGNYLNIQKNQIAISLGRPGAFIANKVVFSCSNPSFEIDDWDCGTTHQF